MWPSRVRRLAKRCRRGCELCEPRSRGDAEGSAEYCKMQLQISNCKLEAQERHDVHVIKVQF